MKRLLLGLCYTPGVGWSTIHKLLASGLEYTAMDWDQTEWRLQYSFLKEEQCKQLANHVDAQFVDRALEHLGHQKIEVISITEEHYPKMLKEIFDPPWLLFAKGDVSILKSPALSFVGSRKTTKYGAAASVKLIQPLVKQDWCIVSGMALGIDAICHRVALQESGKTIAVLGSGINIAYPRQHQFLYEKIAEKGLILSEYPPGTKAHPAFFPRRNRIIAGLSYGTVVIEANKKSGSLITAHLALDYGRDVFAVPGAIFDQQSTGTNLLIQQQGAKLIMGAEDILVEYAHLVQASTGLKQDTRVNLSEIVDAKDKQVLEALSLEKKHVDELCTELSLSFPEISKCLVRLELKKLIQGLPGSFYQRIG